MKDNIKSVQGNVKSRSKPLRHFLWALYFFGLLIASIFIAWGTMRETNYLFPYAYRLLNIADTVTIYGPENRFRKNFEQTSDAERFIIFSQIVEAVHNNGKGLMGITYHDKSGNVIDTFLTAAEIKHLQDVAKLFNLLEYAGWISLLCPALLFYLYKSKTEIPKLRHVMASALSGIAALTLLTVLIGPTRIFYAIHEHIFPPGHQWFFYYQDSLMTTLMQAPNLFGYIGAWIGLFATLLLCGLITLTYGVYRK